MKINLGWIAILALFGTALSSAAEKPPALPAAAQALADTISSGAVYRIRKPEPSCPGVVQVVNDETPHGHLKYGDLPFRLKGFEERAGLIGSGHFVFENNGFGFRPTLGEGKSTSLENSCEIILGIACRFESQKTKEDAIEFEGSAKVISFAMVAFPKVSLRFDAASRELHYVFKANGIDDVVCDYAPAPELAEKVRAFAATEACVASPEKCRVQAQKVSEKARKPAEGALKAPQEAPGLSISPAR